MRSMREGARPPMRDEADRSEAGDRPGCTHGLGSPMTRPPPQVFHGTRASFDRFAPFVKRAQQLGFGIHWAEDPAFAERYATDGNVARKARGASRVYVAQLRARNPLVANAFVGEGTPEFALAKKLAGHRLLTQRWETDELPETDKRFTFVGMTRGARTAYLQHAIDQASPQRAADLIQRAGYDSVRYFAEIAAAGAPGSGYRSVTSSSVCWVVFDPEQIEVLEVYSPSDR